VAGNTFSNEVVSSPVEQTATDLPEEPALPASMTAEVSSTVWSRPSETIAMPADQSATSSFDTSDLTPDETETVPLATQEEDTPNRGRRVPFAVGQRSRQPVANPPERITFSGDGVSSPPRRPFSLDRWFGDPRSSRRRVSLFALLGALTLLAAYVGVAIGDSIQGGGGTPDALPVVGTAGGRARLVACGSGPISLDQGQRVTVSFDSSSLSGYSISSANIRAASPNASAQSVVAKPGQGLNIQVDALPAPGTAGRTDEYRMDVTLDKGKDRLASECTVLVRASGTTTPTVAATGSVTPVRTGTPGTVTPSTTGTSVPGSATPTRVP
jgi:hypothetical protein